VGRFLEFYFIEGQTGERERGDKEICNLQLFSLLLKSKTYFQYVQNMELYEGRGNKSIATTTN
jgi:hypothetical protein